MQPTANSPEMRAPPDVFTELYPHQRKALSFMARREDTLLRHSLPPRPDPRFEPLELFDSDSNERVFLHITEGTLVPQSQVPECESAQSCSGCLFADETGLGKSLTLIATALSRPRETDGLANTIIVAPPALLQQWADEITAHTRNNRNVRVYTGLREFEKRYMRNAGPSRTPSKRKWLGKSQEQMRPSDDELQKQENDCDDAQCKYHDSFNTGTPPYAAPRKCKRSAVTADVQDGSEKAAWMQSDANRPYNPRRGACQQQKQTAAGLVVAAAVDEDESGDSEYEMNEGDDSVLGNATYDKEEREGDDDLAVDAMGSEPERTYLNRGNRDEDAEHAEQLLSGDDAGNGRYVYRGKLSSDAELAQRVTELLDKADFVVTPYNVLRSEVNFDGECKYGLRGKRYKIPLCPLAGVHWKRAVFDESQKVGDGLNEVSKMAQKISADHRYAVTGTPLSDSNPIASLAAHMRTIGHTPLADGEALRAFRNCRSASLAAAVAHEAGWRSTKESTEQLGSLRLPTISNQRVSLQLSSAERVFYDHTRKVSASGTRGSWAFVTQLRLACIHPQLTANWRNASSELQLESGALGINEVVERLMNTSKGKLQKYERDYCSALKNIAAKDSDPREAKATLVEAYDVAENGLLSKGAAEGSVKIEVTPAALRQWQLVQMEIAKRAQVVCAEIGDDQNRKEFHDAAERLRREFLDPSQERVNRLQLRRTTARENALLLAGEIPKLRSALAALLDRGHLGDSLWKQPLQYGVKQQREDQWGELVVEELDRLLIERMQQQQRQQQQQEQFDERDKNDAEDEAEEASNTDDAPHRFLRDREHEASSVHRGVVALGLSSLVSEMSERLQQAQTDVSNGKRAPHKDPPQSIMQKPLETWCMVHILMGSELALSVIRRSVEHEDGSIVSFQRMMTTKIEEENRIFTLEAQQSCPVTMAQSSPVSAQELSVAGAALTKKQLDIIAHLKDQNKATKQLAQAELQKAIRESQLENALSCSNTYIPSRASSEKSAVEELNKAKREASRVRFLQHRLEEFGSSEQHHTSEHVDLPSARLTCVDAFESECSQSPARCPACLTLTCANADAINRPTLSDAATSHVQQKETAEQEIQVDSWQKEEGITWAGQSDREERICPVCLSPFENEALLLPACGHMVCVDCVNARGFAKATVCFYCRAPFKHQDLYRVRLGDEGAKHLRGQWCTKLEAVVSKLQQLQNTEEKVLVFSHFPDALNLLSRAMTSNKIKHVTLLSGTRLDPTSLAHFNNDSQTKAFLLSMQAGSAGLTLARANHVMLLEPGVEALHEKQAIARVHRLGQNRAVTVHRFVVENTVESTIDASISSVEEQHNVTDSSSSNRRHSGEHVEQRLLTNILENSWPNVDDEHEEGT